MCALTPATPLPHNQVIVDEAHHIYSKGSDLEVKAVQECIYEGEKGAKQMLILLSDASQIGTTHGDIKFPAVDQVRHPFP